MKLFKIEIKVAYDDAYPVPKNMVDQLVCNVDFFVGQGLLSASKGETVVDTWGVHVEEK
jgi:hypothetical protein